MSEDIFIQHCSPTLAGLKTGSLINCDSVSKSDTTQHILRINRTMRAKGLRAIILRHTKNRALIYLYRPALLTRDLNDKRARDILNRYGYPQGNTALCLMHLIMRISESSCFPHEIGLFLGYPPDDVLGFIDNKSECKCCGYWKVYGNEEQARREFARYKKCTEVYTRRWLEGYTLDKLTVAV